MDLLVLEADRPPTDVRVAVRTASQHDNWRNALFLAVDWLLMALAATIHVWYGGVLLYVVIVILIGSRMRALANLLHEAAHHKLFASRRVNVLAGRVLCAWPIFISFDNYVRGHRLHHKNLWRNDDDPDVALYRLTGTETGSSDRLSYPAFLLRHVVAVVIPVMPMRRLYDRGRWRYALVGAAVWGVVLAGSWWWWPPLAVGLALYWLVPWLTAYQTISYWAELGEHGGRPRDLLRRVVRVRPDPGAAGRGHPGAGAGDHRARRSLGFRQVDPAAAGQPAAGAGPGHRVVPRRRRGHDAAADAAAPARHGVPAPVAVSRHGAGQPRRRRPRADRRHRPHAAETGRSGAGFPGTRRDRALRRPAAADVPGPGARHPA